MELEFRKIIFCIYWLQKFLGQLRMCVFADILWIRVHV